MLLGEELVGVEGMQTPALGAAMWGAVGARVFDTIADASWIARLGDAVDAPSLDDRALHDTLCAEHLRLHAHFGRGGNDVMRRLRKQARHARKETTSRP
jgi:L-ribulokinase